MIRSRYYHLSSYFFKLSCHLLFITIGKKPLHQLLLLCFQTSAAKVELTEKKINKKTIYLIVNHFRYIFQL